MMTAHTPRGRWRRKRAERRLIALERRLRNLDKHASWEASFDRWGPAQESKHDRDRAALIASLNDICERLGVDHVYR